jgi:hypothetical protein
MRPKLIRCAWRSLERAGVIRDGLRGSLLFAERPEHRAHAQKREYEDEREAKSEPSSHLGSHPNPTWRPFRPASG